jgi:DUF971 family protein
MAPIITPTEIKRSGEGGLEIAWNDGKRSRLSSETLRKNCPCAVCREERGDSSHGAPLSPKKSLLRVIEHTSDEQLRLVEIWAVGNYAVGMRWGDGHDTGIYKYELLRDLGN